MKILILGKGYIGNYLAKKETEHNLIHLSKNDVDYSNPDVFIEYIKNNHVDWIINSSGYTGNPNVDACENNKEDCYHYNVTVPLYLTKIANKFEIPIIHIGSGCIYSGYDKIYTENDSSDFGVDSFTSSFYSKTKDAFEKLSSRYNRYIFRIRIPFNGVPESKNYLYKLLHYDNLISMPNSVTNVDDLFDFTYKFIEKKPLYGIYNVTNTGSIEARTIISLMRKNNLDNNNWRFVSIEEANFKVARSNCILNNDKIRDIDLELPDVNVSIENSIKEYKNNLTNNEIKLS
jgi:dTDP-4-dehydrorhamnose reductase